MKQIKLTNNNIILSFAEEIVHELVEHCHTIGSGFRFKDHKQIYEVLDHKLMGPRLITYSHNSPYYTADMPFNSSTCSLLPHNISTTFIKKTL